MLLGHLSSDGNAPAFLRLPGVLKFRTEARPSYAEAVSFLVIRIRL
jgi:hypothetical protein